MGNEEEQKQSPENPNKKKEESMFSPGFRSVVAMAGWDEETLLMASLVVEDTPDREDKHKKRFKTPPTTSRRKRRSHRRSPASVVVPVLDLDEATQTPAEESEQKRSPASVVVPGLDLDETAKTLTEESEQKTDKVKSIEDKKVEEVQIIEKAEQGASASCSSSSLPCIDRLREELSCAICLEICFEPSTTPCGHSFCKKCLRSAADKCGKRCPKCRQLISNGRSCTVNTVLWNTIQLLFPQEVETRQESAKSKSTREMADKTPERRRYYNARNRSIEALNSPENDGVSIRIPRISRRANVRPVASQDEDAALALRLQREEFMEVFRGGENEPHQQLNRRSNSLNSARANLRAIASRAINIQIRSRQT